MDRECAISRPVSAPALARVIVSFKIRCQEPASDVALVAKALALTASRLSGRGLTALPT